LGERFASNKLLFLFKIKGWCNLHLNLPVNLTQCLFTDNSLDLIFTNFGRVNTFFADVGVVKPDPCHPPIVIEIPLDLRNSASYYEHSYPKYALRDYGFLFSFLSNYDWSRVCVVITQYMLQ
jgi:hypothetical protein